MARQQMRIAASERTLLLRHPQERRQALRQAPKPGLMEVAGQTCLPDGLGNRDAVEAAPVRGGTELEYMPAESEKALPQVRTHRDRVEGSRHPVRQLGSHGNNQLPRAAE